ncbi:MAG: hypothetical protein CM15mP106_1230 [Candidatus Neomarinimicrobiota bacterium]|nr:MAG: hypothetical protein CM15mP106_1230 [Candidatus Neomarinimicrobiota bacterium]
MVSDGQGGDCYHQPTTGPHWSFSQAQPTLIRLAWVNQAIRTYTQVTDVEWNSVGGVVGTAEIVTNTHPQGNPDDLIFIHVIDVSTSFKDVMNS